MKKEIDDIVALAKKYAKFGKDNYLPTNNHNGLNKEEDVVIYFGNDRDIWVVDFKDTVRVVDYGNRIELPMDVTEEQLHEIYLFAVDFFNNDLIDKTEEIKEMQRKATENKIKKLKDELKTLEELAA